MKTEVWTPFAAVMVLLVAAAPAHGAAPIETLPGVDSVVLAPTKHATLPTELSQLWLAPDRKALERTPALEQLVEAVRLESVSNYAAALPILSRAAVQRGTLGHYALYYKGLAELRLKRFADAGSSFRKLVEAAPVGLLAEAARLREAEAAEALGDYAAALAIYETLAPVSVMAPDDVRMRAGRTAKALGDATRAAAAFASVYYEFPLSDQAIAAGTELASLRVDVPVSSDRYGLDLRRAERLFTAKRYSDARAAFEGLRGVAPPGDRELVALRVAECDVLLKRSREGRDALRPYLDKAARRGEALYFHALALRDLGETSEYERTLRRVASEFPNEMWAEESLNQLATRFIVQGDDVRADDTFRELLDRFPAGRFAERASWKVGWWAYKNARYAETYRVFERAATLFPRSDYRPAWVYWAGRAHGELQEPGVARERYLLVSTDYLNSYYGRLAVSRLSGVVPERRPVANPTRPAAARPGSGGESGTPIEPLPPAPLPPNQHVIRALLGVGLYEQALDELRFAQKAWGESAPVQATMAWIYWQQGQRESGTRQFGLLRGAITTMRRAYPQFLAAGGEHLPRELLQVIFPIRYWELIRKHAEARELDPYLVAALTAQESTFVPDIKSSANAVGLMQLMPATARRMARSLKMKYSPRLLTNPDANIQLGTAYLAGRVKEFGDVHLVLASYNAGEGSVRRWMTDRTGLARDEFIEDIPYPETQNYVKRILGTAEDYRRLYGVAAAPATVEDRGVVAPAPRVAAISSPASRRGTDKVSRTTSAASSKKPLSPRKKRHARTRRSGQKAA